MSFCCHIITEKYMTEFQIEGGGLVKASLNKKKRFFQLFLPGTKSMLIK